MIIIDSYHSLPHSQSYNPHSPVSSWAGADETFKGSIYMTEALLDLVIGHSDAPENTTMAARNLAAQPRMAQTKLDTVPDPT